MCFGICVALGGRYETHQIVIRDSGKCYAWVVVYSLKKNCAKCQKWLSGWGESFQHSTGSDWQISITKLSRDVNNLPAEYTEHYVQLENAWVFHEHMVTH